MKPPPEISTQPIDIELPMLYYYSTDFDWLELISLVTSFLFQLQACFIFIKGIRRKIKRFKYKQTLIISVHSRVGAT